ncbi:DNA-protecting protein DprA, partial [bacterium]
KKLTGSAKIVFEALSHDPLHIDDIARKCKMEPSYALSALFTLELEGLIKQLPGKRFLKNI